MSYLVSLLALCLCGLALVRLLRLGLGVRSADLGLAWFLGCGWFALSASALRFLFGLPTGRVVCLVLLGAPLLGWAALRRRLGAPAPRPRARWMPAPRWLFAPLAAYAIVALALILVHGFNTPTQTDDALRARGAVALLSLDESWSPAVRVLFTQAGPFPTFVPSLAWRLAGPVDHFHLNYVIATSLVALLLLLVGTSAARGRPEQGWLCGFAILSLPLFAYHCTSTYADALLAMIVGAAIYFLDELGRGDDPGDAARVLLLCVVAALVKAEGELVAAPVALVALVLVARRRGLPAALRASARLSPYLAYAATKIAAVGVGTAFPFLVFLLYRAQQPVAVAAAAAASAPAAASGTMWSSPGRIFVYALFDSGNAGMLFWVLGATLLLGARRALRSGLGWALLAIALLFAEAAVSAVWLYARFTLDQTTVHRGLLAVSVAAAIWLASFFSGLWEGASRGSDEAAGRPG